MSVYIVSDDGLAPLVSFAIAYALPYRDARRGHYVNAKPEQADELGRMMQAENLRSYQARYRGKPVDVVPYAHKPMQWRAADSVAMLHKVREALDCFEYQACEAHDWHASEAASLCNAVRRKLLDGFAARVRR